MFLCFSYTCYVYLWYLHVFPTRRSSDLDVRRDFIAFKRRLGYVPEEAHVYPALTGMEYLQLMGRLREMPSRSTPDKHADRKSTRLNSSHTVISYAVFCLKKKKKKSPKQT